MGLVARIKHGQRYSEAFKEAWIRYCDENANGFKDPTRHSIEFLREFLMMAPDVQTCDDDEEHREIVNRIKDGQRSDEAYKQAWWKYCEDNGSTLMDPVKHEKAFLKSFINSYEKGSAIASGPGAYAKVPNNESTTWSSRGARS